LEDGLLNLRLSADMGLTSKTEERVFILRRPDCWRLVDGFERGGTHDYIYIKKIKI
jgi:hypothetical protein